MLLCLSVCLSVYMAVTLCVCDSIARREAFQRRHYPSTDVNKNNRAKGTWTVLTVQL